LETTFLIEGQTTQSQQPQQPQTSQLNRRSKMETYCDIVKAIGAGAEKPTHIMYRANLSWTVMQGYIKDLEAQGLVVSQESDGKRLYKLTEKGFLLLKQYVSIKEDLRLLPDV
jgi:predicted transcriptional regulator